MRIVALAFALTFLAGAASAGCWSGTTADSGTKSTTTAEAPIHTPVPVEPTSGS